MEQMMEIKKGLGIDEYLELIKEDKNLNMAYVSLAQYIYLLEQELDDEILNKEIAQGHRKQVQDIELSERKELEIYKSKIQNATKKIQKIKEHIDKSGFDGMTKAILIMGINEIQKEL